MLGRHLGAVPLLRPTSHEQDPRGRTDTTWGLQGTTEIKTIKTTGTKQTQWDKKWTGTVPKKHHQMENQAFLLCHQAHKKFVLHAARMKKKKQKEMLEIFWSHAQQRDVRCCKSKMIDVIFFLVVYFSLKYEKWLFHMPKITREVGYSCCLFL